MGETVMNEEKLNWRETLRAIAADQDLALAQLPRETDTVAEEAIRRAWNRRRKPLIPYLAVAGLAGAAAFAVAFLVLRAGRKDLSFEIAGRTGQAGTSVTAADGSPLPLQFSDGSHVVFQPGAHARVNRVTDTGAELLLENGRLVADVRHTDEARWSVSAGPFKVRVTGTRFAADWSPGKGKLSVEMFEGSVLVDGPSLGGGLALRAGETLEVGVSSLAVVTRTVKAGALPVGAGTDGVPKTPAVFAGATDPSPTATAQEASQEPSQQPTGTPVATSRPLSAWADLAAAGRYTESLRAAERDGFARLCSHLDAEQLLALGDAARFASSENRARQAFQALVHRFPRDQRSHDALFALGRLESAAGQPAASARWFERYLKSARMPPLAEEAAGRLVEIYADLGDTQAAARASRSYLERHPNGPRAGFARRVLGAQAAVDLER